MRRFFSTVYSETFFNIGTFLLRLVAGFLLCLNHGIPKITHFGDMQHTFYDFAHIGHRWSLVLSILAEVFAAMFLILGLFARLAALLIVIDLGVAIFVNQTLHPMSRYEDAVLFFVIALFLLFVGPGRYSVDGASGR